MRSITPRRRKDGVTTYTAQVRIRIERLIVHSESRTFPRRREAVAWAVETERALQKPGALEARAWKDLRVSDLIDLYLKQFASDAGRTKAAALKSLKKWPVAELVALQVKSSDIVEHARLRRTGGASPATINGDIVWLRVIFRTARPAWNVPIDIAPIAQAAVLLRKERMIARSRHRDRRPSSEELAILDDYFARRDQRAEIPMRDVMWFAVHSARRQSEITRITRTGLADKAGTVQVRDIKHPGGKGYHRISRLTLEAQAIIERQPNTGDRIFPYNCKSISAAFTRACKACGIKDLRFHDLRHEGTSRLFEAGYSIVEVQQFSLHESWDQLKRYTNLNPANVALR